MFNDSHPRAVLILALGLFTLCAGPLFAQGYVLEVGSRTTGPGGTVTIPVTLDTTNGAPVSGWSFGVCHDETELTLATAESGATTATSNLGQPPEFEDLDLLASGYSQAVVICFSFCSSLPAQPGHELASGTYQAIAPGGTLSPITLCPTLGVPPVALLIVDQSAGEFFPTVVGGGVDIVDLDITGLACDVVGASCSCSYDLSWVNGGSYDEIEVRVDGAVTEVLAGNATSTLIPDFGVGPGGAAQREICLTPIVGGIAGNPTCCTPSCQVQEAPLGGALATSPGSGGGCEVDLVWSGFVFQSAVTASVFIDGNLALAGLVGSTATIQLPSAGPHVVCVVVTDTCGFESGGACQTVNCTATLDLFRRSDANLDSSTNLADGIFVLDVLFIGNEVLDCFDAADANDDGMVDISDVIFTLDYLFTSGPTPPAPGLGCGSDPTPDGLGCLGFTGC